VVAHLIFILLFIVPHQRSKRERDLITFAFIRLFYRVPSRSYVAALESRIKVLESLLKTASIAIPRPPPYFSAAPDDYNAPDNMYPDLDDSVNPLEFPEDLDALADLSKLNIGVQREQDFGGGSGISYFGAMSGRHILVDDSSDREEEDSGRGKADVMYRSWYIPEEEENIIKSYWKWQRVWVALFFSLFLSLDDNPYRSISLSYLLVHSWMHTMVSLTYGTRFFFPVTQLSFEFSNWSHYSINEAHTPPGSQGDRNDCGYFPPSQSSFCFNTVHCSREM